MADKSGRLTLVGDGHSTLGNDVLSAEQVIQHYNTTLQGHYNVDHFSINFAILNCVDNLRK